jgi:hypothetical protein
VYTFVVYTARALKLVLAIREHLLRIPPRSRWDNHRKEQQDDHRKEDDHRTTGKLTAGWTF